MKLNLACGKEYLDGYINIDDCSMFSGCKVDKNVDILTMKCQAESYEEIRVSHFAMYLRPKEMQEQLKRWFTWLKVGGKLQIETIDLNKVARLAIHPIPDVAEKNGLVNLFGTDETGPHRWGWSRQALTEQCRKVGFSHIKISRGLKKPKRDFLLTCIKS